MSSSTSGSASGKITILKVSAPAAVRSAGRRELDRWYFGRRVASEAGCSACHRIGESGNSGPGVALTRIGARLSEKELEKVLLDAPAPMPSFRGMPRDKLRPLVLFLALLRGEHRSSVAAISFAKTNRARAGSRGATREYVRAEHAMAEAVARGDAARTDAGNALVAKIKLNCDDILGEAPEAGPALTMRMEAVTDLAYVRLLSSRTAYLKFAGTVEKLRWASAALTADVRRQATLTRETVSLVEPNLCEDANAFAASHYQTVPADTSRFLAEERTLESEGEVRRPGGKKIGLTEVIDKLMMPYERLGEQAYLKPPPQSRADQESFVRGLGEILQALGIPQK